MNKILITITYLILCSSLNAQIIPTISPDVTNEYCPNTNTTFTVTIPGYDPFIFGWTNNPILISVTYPPFNVAASTTFTFVGRFQDANIAQTFRVNCKRQNKVDTSYDFTFKKIKSLFYPNPTGTSVSSPCQIFRANQILVTAPRCQIVNIPISVVATNWSTYAEGSDFCWGSISTYEYQLPNGWSIGSNVSTGTNWIAGGASVTVTSDLSNGINGLIRIRPTNNCGTGLSNNANQTTISIDRPAPVLSISGSQDYICNVGQSATFTTNGIPSGATIVWTISDPSVAAFVGSNTSPNVTISKTANFTGFVNVSATVTDCITSYPVGPKQIALGTGRTTVFFAFHNVYCELPQRPYYNGAVEEFTSATNYQWYAKDMSNPSNPFVLKVEGSPTADFPFGRNKGNRYYTIKVIATTPCGTVSTIESEGLLWVPSCVGSNQRILVSPNPVNSNLNISFKQVANEERKVIDDNIQAVEVRNKTGIIVLNRKFSKDTKQTTINVSGLKPDIYVVSIWNGKEWISEEFIKQ